VLAAHDIQKRVGRYVPGKTKKFEASMMQSMTPTAVFKCLADDTRSKITLLIVAQGELCVCELTASLDLSQPKISRHLALLRSAGLLMDRRQGQWVYYQLHPALPTWVTALLKDVVDANQCWLETETTRLCNMDGRPDNQAVCS
jgi:DNA-binding transcriptional ArsR family regulator